MKKASETDPILKKLSEIQLTARKWVFGRGILFLLNLGFGLVFLGVLLDHLLALQRAGRAVFLSVFLVISATGFLGVILFSLLARLGRAFVARQVERATPDLRNSLITYLQYRENRRAPAETMAFLQRRIYPLVRGVDRRLLAGRERSVRLAWVLIGLTVAFGAYAMLSPKSVIVSLQRLFEPAADILPPTRTRITSVEPGDVYLLRGDGLAVRAQVRGVEPDGACVLWSGTSFTDRRVLLARGEDNTWRAELPAVLEDGAYCVVAGDMRSERYKIAVLPRPAVTEVAARLDAPAYARQESHLVNGGNLDVLADTRVQLTARTNLPPAAGYLEFDSGRRVWLNVSDGALRAEFTVVESDSYRVFFETLPYPDGSVFKNSSPVTFRINCRPDLGPVVRILAPPDLAGVAPDARVQVQYRAEDDFGLQKLSFRYEINGVEGAAVALPLEHGARATGGAYDWDLGKLSLRTGDLLHYYIEVADNWPRGPHTARSERRRILIGIEELPRVAAADAKPRPKGESVPLSSAGPPNPKAAEGKPADQQRGAEQPAPRRQEAERIARLFRQKADERKSGVCKLCGGKIVGGVCTSCGAGGSSGSGAGGGGSESAAGGSQASGQGGGSSGTGGSGQSGNAGGRNASQGKGASQTAGSSPKGGAEGGSAAAGSQSSGQGEGASSAGATASSPRNDDGAGAQTGPDGKGPSQTASSAEGGSLQPAGSSGAAGTGASRNAVAAPEMREGPLADGEIRGALKEVERELAEGTLPEELLKDLGMNRRQLEEFVKRYKETPEEQPAGGQQKPGEPETAPPGGRIIEAGAEGAPDLAVRGAAPEKIEKDKLRSRFEDASDRISPRYREAVNAYYKKLSEE